MPAQNYTAEHHERGFKIWWETKSYTRVAEQMQVGVDTVRRWSKADFCCPNGCQWHDWEKLAAERQATLSARVKLYNEQNLDPASHADAVKGVVKHDSTTTGSVVARRRVLETLVRSDLERASHWELIYAIVFQQVTGISLPHTGMLEEEQGISTAELYKAARKITTMEGGIRALRDAQAEIDKLKERLGIYKAGKAAQPAEVPAEVEAEATVETLSIDDARRFQQLIANSSPEQIELIKKMMKADSAVIAAAMGKQDTPVQSEVPLPVTLMPPPLPPEFQQTGT